MSIKYFSKINLHLQLKIKIINLKLAFTSTILRAVFLLPRRGDVKQKSNSSRKL